jgi:hypothetical protein
MFRVWEQVQLQELSQDFTELLPNSHVFYREKPILAYDDVLPQNS